MKTSNEVTYFKIGNILVVLGPVELQSHIEGDKVVFEVTRSMQMSAPPNPRVQSDGVPPQEPGDLTPADVHEKMWRLRQSRRR